MRLTRLRLSNYKPYGSADVQLDRGVTVIYGPNGSGKSSLLEASFFALYGAPALQTRLDDVISNGEEETEIELWFDHAGQSYRVTRRVRISGDRAQTVECRLDTPDDVIDGARDVQRRVTSLLRMDEEAFLNCAYVRQGEVNKLINATPTARQEMLDELLQLGVLQEYRNRATEARLGVEDVLSESRGELDGIQDQIADKEAANLQERLNDLETELAEVDSEIESYEANRDQAQDRLEEAEAILEEYEDHQEDIATLTDDIESLREAIIADEDTRDDLVETITETRDELADLTDRRTELASTVELESVTESAISELLSRLEDQLESLNDDREALQQTAAKHSSTAETARERVTELEADIEDTEESIESLEAELTDAKATLAEREETIADLDEKIESTRALFAQAPIESGEAAEHLQTLREERESLIEQRTELETAIETTRTEITRGEELLAAGKCPECGQPVDEAPHVESLDDRRDQLSELEADRADLDEEIETLEERIENAESLQAAERDIEQLEEKRKSISQLRAETEAAITDKEERLEQHRETLESLERALEEKRETLAEAEAARERITEKLSELDEQGEELTNRIERIEELESLRSSIADKETEIEQLQERRSLLEERIEERQSTLSDKQTRRQELRDAFDEERLEWAQNERPRAVEYLEEVNSMIEELHDRRDNIQNRIGGIEAEIDALDDLRERRDSLETRVTALESLHDELSEMEAMYGDLRVELRQRNIAALEGLLNETFELIYENDAYARIELDDAYELTVYQKDGSALDPGQLSGGERALFNLSLRTAIYRLLAEGIDGTAPMPPLILDEPTVFLDSGHVSRLVELVESMRSLGVEQIIVVSHDEELVGAADEFLTVQKDPTTNRSSVGRAQVSDA